MSHSIDINETNFLSDVIAASETTPVLVDFWASWCEPCKSLMPVLTKLADEYAGKFILAKIEIDQQQELARQFAVRSVPTVMMIINGEVVDQFSGALPENQVRDFINKHLQSSPGSPLQQALKLYQEGETDAALAQMQEVLLAEPANPMVRIEFANILMREKRFDDARDLLQSLSAADKTNPAALALFTQLDAINAVMDAPDIDELILAIEKDPSNCQLREQLTAHYQLRGDFISAMDQLLEIVRCDRTYNDDAGRKGLLKIFELLGQNHELVTQYRRKLAQQLN